MCFEEKGSKVYCNLTNFAYTLKQFVKVQDIGDVLHLIAHLKGQFMIFIEILSSKEESKVHFSFRSL